MSSYEHIEREIEQAITELVNEWKELAVEYGLDESLIDREMFRPTIERKAKIFAICRRHPNCPDILLTEGRWPWKIIL